MADVTEQLVRSITEQVIAAMSASPVGDGATGRSAPAAIHPPIGVCTGDYSKFPELKGRAIGGGPVTTAKKGSEGAAPGESAGGPSPLSGFITARQVEAIAGPVVVLDAGARLTPLAADCIRERGLRVERLSDSAAASGGSGRPATTYLWWIDGQCPTVRQVTTELRTMLRPAPASSASSLPATIRHIAAQVKAGKAAGAILFVRSAAAAVCYANRCPSLRAAVATCGEAVEQAISLIAANTLIVEYPHQGLAAIRAMTERFIAAVRPHLPHLHRDLAELSRCV